MVTVQDVQEVFGANSLQLDLLKNKSNNSSSTGKGSLKSKATHCPNTRRYVRVLVQRENLPDETRLIFVRCKQWSCPFCAKKNAEVLFSKVRRGIKGCLEAERRDGFRDEHALKFLTLTLPGREYRDSNSRRDSEKTMKYSFSKMVSQLRRIYGHFEYAWVREFQDDGFAHLHVVLVGQAIAPKKIYDDISRIWREQQGLGYIQLKAAKGGVDSMASYLSKYMTKSLEAADKGSHVYGFSRGFAEAMGKDKPSITLIERGVFSCDDGIYNFTPQWVISDGIDLDRAAWEKMWEEDIAEDLHYQEPLPI